MTGAAVRWAGPWGPGLARMIAAIFAAVNRPKFFIFFYLRVKRGVKKYKKFFPAPVRMRVRVRKVTTRRRAHQTTQTQTPPSRRGYQPTRHPAPPSRRGHQPTRHPAPPSRRGHRTTRTRSPPSHRDHQSTRAPGYHPATGATIHTRAPGTTTPQRPPATHGHKTRTNTDEHAAQPARHHAGTGAYACEELPQSQTFELRRRQGIRNPSAAFLRLPAGVGPPARGVGLRVGRSPEGGVGFKIKKVRFAGEIFGGRGQKMK